MIIHLACDLARVVYHKDQYWVQFCFFFTSICNVSNLLKFVLFADDTNIFCSSTSLHALQDTINRELAKLFVWFLAGENNHDIWGTNFLGIIID